MVRAWLSVAIVKTLVSYCQMPTVVSVLKDKWDREVTGVEMAQMVLFAPIVNLVAWPYFLKKEGVEFFHLHSRQDVEKKLKEIDL